MTELTELIRTERLAFIDLLESLTEDQWQTPSLCSAWTVEHVAAHLAWAPVSARWRWSRPRCARVSGPTA